MQFRIINKCVHRSLPTANKNGFVIIGGLPIKV